MSKIDEIMKLLSEAKRSADEINEDTLSFQIGTALMLAQEISLGQTSKRPRR
ncbi:hypothetical protein [Aminobacter carboxidus]|uniref:Uncharacterized protein n=1 Tax=Aminobacter carboxidus TaxID=376165 RepID=A0ABR9GWN9_9HYPH|nr:hypothetical protein [Aminobacter carboxidus]MBE1208086.1 hypothetical protein [Aminobacter carboxidus]